MISAILALVSAVLTVSDVYQNPVLNADYSDPDVVEVNGEYWFTSSSFNCVPGLQILHSTDLVDWKLVGAAVPAESPYWDGALEHPDHGNAIWAPAIRYRESEGRFYIFWGDPDRGIFQVNAEDPAGIWTDPLCVIPGKGMIDPCPLFDDDGRVYLVHAWAKSRAGFNGVLHVCELDSGCTRALTEHTQVFDGNATGNFTVEGPKFYKRGEYYWIFAPAGSVKTGWQLAMRSKSVYGPYEYRRVLEAADEADAASGKAAATRGPHQGAWVQDAEGDSWFLHFEDRYAWGRVVHLQPMEWTDDGWCIIGSDVDGDGVGEPVASWRNPATFKAVRKFDGMLSDGGWQWHGKPENGWKEGWRNLWDTPNMFLEKIVGPRTELSARLKYGGPDGRSGMIVMGLDYSTLELCAGDDGVELQRRVCIGAREGGEEKVVWKVSCPEGEVYVRLLIEDRTPGEPYACWPPVVVCRWEYSLDGVAYMPAGPEFTAKEGRWIGAKAGFFSKSADFFLNLRHD